MLTMNLPTSLSRAVLGAAATIGTALALGQGGMSQIRVRVDKPGVTISPTFYGLMTEEINHSYDGGLYAELLQNRSFRDGQTGSQHWSFLAKGNAAGGLGFAGGSSLPNALEAILYVEASKADKNSPVGAVNDGFWGVPLTPHTTYRSSLYAKSSSGFSGPLTVSLQSADSKQVFATAVVPKVSREWRKYSVTLHTGRIESTTNGRFFVSISQPGKVELRDLSLFPPTFNNRPNGNRIDLMKMLGEMKPSFLRLPGGNYLEGNTIPERFNWKETIGDTSNRPGHQCPWGYRSSDGLGLLEYLEWCEDLHMQPLLAVYAGYSLAQQYVAPGPKLTPYVEDALDEIEYVTGSVQTKWGAIRAKNGHPKPFPLAYIEVGNEDQFDRSQSYDGRFAQFYDAIKARWPKLQIIATAPVRSRKPDVVDDHYYRSAAEMARDSGHYDRYSRTGSKIFVGEWASIGGNPTPTFKEAIGDAAWLTGLERNSDLVVMEAYAPLMVNVNPGGSQWPTNLIGYDGLSSFGSPSYYVQAMFGQYTGKVVLPVDIKLAGQKLKLLPAQHGGIGLGTYTTNAEYKDAKVTAEGKTLYSEDFSHGAGDWKFGAGTWRVEGGALRQSSNRRETHASAGNLDWTDYTYEVKARKISGAEGFFIKFHVLSAQDFIQWNIGGWGNSRSAIQRHDGGEIDEIGDSSDTTVVSGRWYDLKVVLTGSDVKCYLDGKLVNEATVVPRAPASALYAAASSTGNGGDVFLKVVNVSDGDISTEINLDGAQGLEATAQGWVLTGKLEDANTVKEPRKVAPKAISVPVSGQTFEHRFPAHSVTVLNFKTSGLR